MTRCAVCGRACSTTSELVPAEVSDWLASRAVCQRQPCRDDLSRLNEDISHSEQMEIIPEWEMYTTPGDEIEGSCREGRQAQLDEFGSWPLGWLKRTFRTIQDSRPSAGEEQ